MIYLFLLFFGGAFIFLFLAVRKAKRSMSWPATHGTIRTSQLRRTTGRAGSYYPAVSYEYSVAGKTYTGTTVAVIVDGISRWEARSMLLGTQPLPYLVGQTLTVYYNPSDNAESVLVRGTTTRGMIFLWVTGLGSLIIIGTIFYGLTHGPNF